MLVAGEYGKMGAAELAVMACLKSGIGLLSVHIPKSGYEIMQTACPEAMCLVDENQNYITNVKLPDKVNALGIGPGIGTNDKTANAIFELLTSIDFPVVLDADAINILAKYPNKIGLLPKQSILTPHVKEFERLVGVCDSSFQRLEKLREFLPRASGKYRSKRSLFCSL